MIDPTGPVPRRVYLRRRAFAVAGAVLAVILLVWIISGLVGGAEEPPTAVHPAAAPASSPPADAPHPAASSSSTAPPSPEAPPAPTTPPPDPNAPCPDQAVGVSAEVDQPTAKVGQRPLMRLVVTNTGPVPCTRDIGREHRELVITTRDGATRLWSSNDCLNVKGKDPRVLQAGERVAFEVRWAGRTSAAGCPARRQLVEAGEYSVQPRLGALSGPPVPFAMTP